MQIVLSKRRIVILAVILVIISFAGCIASSIAEVIALTPPKKIAERIKTIAQKQAEEPKPAIHPLDMLPELIKGFNTNARQKMAGAEGYIAEAIYQPDDTDLITRIPLNTYVSITYYYSGKEAEDAIEASAAEQYPVDKKPIEIDGTNVLSGFDSNRGSFYIGWTMKQYSIELVTSFTLKIPPRGDSFLTDYGERVSIAVADSSAKALGKKD